MYEAQIVEHKMDIERLERELQEVKKKYYLQKKKEHNQRYNTCGYITMVIINIIVQRARESAGSWYGPSHDHFIKDSRHASLHRWGIQPQDNSKNNSIIK